METTRQVYKLRPPVICDVENINLHPFALLHRATLSARERERAVNYTLDVCAYTEYEQRAADENQQWVCGICVLSANETIGKQRLKRLQQDWARIAVKSIPTPEGQTAHAPAKVAWCWLADDRSQRRAVPATDLICSTSFWRTLQTHATVATALGGDDIKCAE